MNNQENEKKKWSLKATTKKFNDFKNEESENNEIPANPAFMVPDPKSNTTAS